MLHVLFGSQNIQRVLLFLFVNGKCYGAQLHRVLHTALTPLQKALNRLEQGGLIMSYYEGKTRIYQFNQAYPLLHELELLLKKAYTLLPADEKKRYYAIKEDISVHAQNENKPQVLLAFWARLVNTTQLTFCSKTHSSIEQGRSGRGKGEVIATREGNNVVVFTEKGTWHGKQGSEMHFSNVFRWTLDRKGGLISLEHLRHGPEAPVFLFYLMPTGPSTLSCVDSHLCEGDMYFGQIHFDRSSFRLHWRVIGSKKNEEIDYYYS